MAIHRIELTHTHKSIYLLTRSLISINLPRYPESTTPQSINTIFSLLILPPFPKSMTPQSHSTVPPLYANSMTQKKNVHSTFVYILYVLILSKCVSIYIRPEWKRMGELRAKCSLNLQK